MTVYVPKLSFFFLIHFKNYINKNFFSSSSDIVSGSSKRTSASEYFSLTGNGLIFDITGPEDMSNIFMRSSLVCFLVIFLVLCSLNTSHLFSDFSVNLLPVYQLVTKRFRLYSCYVTLLLCYIIAILFLLCYIIAMLHYCYVTLLLCYILAMLHSCYVTFLLCYIIAMLHYCYVILLLFYSCYVILLLCYIIAMLYYCYVILLLCYIIAMLYYCYVILLLCYIIAMLYYCYVIIAMLYYCYIYFDYILALWAVV